MRAMKRAVLWLPGLIMLVVLGGFAVFGQRATREHHNRSPTADGIVALTGGEERIQVAIGLLRQGAGRRLLISGANPKTSKEAIRGQTGEQRDLFNCCIDIGREAGDTVGNAEEARDWAEAKGFQTLIVVTSSYHMPRALTEFARVMPQATLLPHPVVSRSIREQRWWWSPATLSLFAREYAKFLASVSRLAASRLAERIGL